MDKYVLKHSLRWMAGVLALSIAGGSYVYAQRPKEVRLDIDDRVVELYTSAATVEEALKEAGLTDLTGAYVSEDLQTVLRDQMSVQVDTLKKVQVIVGDTPQSVSTRANTVGALLAEEGLVPEAQDEIRPARESALHDGEVIRIDRIETHRRVQKEAVPFEVETTSADDLYEGEEELLQEGVEGLREIETETIFRNGKLERRTVVRDEVVHQPVAERVAQGTKERPAGRASGSVPSGGYTLVMESTAYTHTGNPTATGTWPQAYHTVATDPSVIPLGTRLYIEGYGYAVAEDTGGAVNGNIIDLFFDSESECINWGRQNVVVHVLD